MLSETDGEEVNLVSQAIFVSTLKSSRSIFLYCCHVQCTCLVLSQLNTRNLCGPLSNTIINSNL